MSKYKTFTGPLAAYMQGLLIEKRKLGFKYGEQERLLFVLDKMSKSFDCNNSLPKSDIIFCQKNTKIIDIYINE